MIDRTDAVHLSQFLQQVKGRSDRMMNFFLWGFFGVGLILALFYETWLIAIGVGGLSLVAYYSTKFMLPQSNLYQYVLSVVVGIFMAQYIYQMHGLFEMHFLAFVGSAILITYQNWKLQIPLALLVIVHHALFAYLQFTGMEIYFTELPYMTLQTFVIHGILATVIFAICGLWAHNFHVSSQAHLQQSFEIGKLQEADLQKEVLIQERKRSEGELEKSHSMVQATLQSTADGILVTDYNGKIVLFNGKFAQLWGSTEEQLSKMSEAELLASTLDLLVEPETFMPQIEHIYMQPEGMSYDVLKFKRGMILERYSQPQYILGQAVGRVWNFRDITARKMAEELLEQQNKELIKTNSELDRFAYSASHELRAPLTSVLGLISIARGNESEPSKLKVLEMMQVSIDRLDLFIKDIVNFSSNTKLELAHEKIDFEELIAHNLAELRYMPELEKIGVFTEVVGESDFYSDQRRITVVLNNLISNAIKYQNADQEKPYIHILVKLTQESATITISDNGPGIDAKYQDKIFNMFYRATQRKSGAGLGLYIVKEIIDRMSGKVSVESEVGKGATFVVSIPANSAG